MENVQNDNDAESIRTEVQLISKHWNDLSTDQRDELIGELIDDVCGVTFPEIVFGEGITSLEEIEDIVSRVNPALIPDYSRPTDPELASLFDSLITLNEANDKAPYTETPHAPCCNKNIMQMYDDLSDSDKSRVHEHLGTCDVDAATEKSTVMYYVLLNFIIKNELL